MRGTKLLAAVAAMLALGQPALAATYLCVENVSTGFDWSNGRWVQTNYVTEQHIIQRRLIGDDIAGGCYSRMEKDGRSTLRIEDGVLGDQWTCYSQINVGEEADYMDVSPCKELYYSGALYTVTCDDGFAADFKFEPAGEFVVTRTGGAPLTVDNLAQPRDSLAIAVGKCSVIAP